MQLSEQQTQPAIVVLRGKSRWLVGATFLAGLVAGIGAFALIEYFLGRTVVGVAQTTAGIVDRLASLTFESRTVPAGSTVMESGERIADVIATLAVHRSSDNLQADSIYVATFTPQFPERAARSDSVYVGFVVRTRPLVIELRRSRTPPMRRPRAYLAVPGADLIPVF